MTFGGSGSAPGDDVPIDTTRPLDEVTIDRLLDGDINTELVPPELAEVAALVRVARRPAEPNEVPDFPLVGLDLPRLAAKTRRHRRFSLTRIFTLKAVIGAAAVATAGAAAATQAPPAPPHAVEVPATAWTTVNSIAESRVETIAAYEGPGVVALSASTPAVERAVPMSFTSVARSSDTEGTEPLGEVAVPGPPDLPLTYGDAEALPPGLLDATHPAVVPDDSSASPGHGAPEDPDSDGSGPGNEAGGSPGSDGDNAGNGHESAGGDPATTGVNPGDPGRGSSRHPGGSDDSGTAPGQSGTAPGHGGTAPGRTGSAPGQSGSAETGPGSKAKGG